ncbi:hypothetical protein [Tenacibaculum phage JQ]|nr:hypothetical protein [Tenacibaculum phage JQ]
MLTGSIDLNKIDKSKVVTTDKNGNPFSNGAKYLNVVVWLNDTPDQYGNNASIQISQSKEEREQKQKATYIGNLKEYQSNVNDIPVNGAETVAPDLGGASDDLPF